MSARASVFAACLLLAAPASAQDDARALFESGSAALEARDFPRAVDDLSRSLAVTPRPGTAANLAVALRESGRPTESTTLLERLLGGQLGELSTELEAALRAEHEESAARCATLALRSSEAVDLRVRIDEGEPFEVPASESVETRVDPGSHAIVAEADGRTPMELRVQLSAGERETVDLSLRANVPRATLIVSATDPSHEVEIVGVARAPGTLQEQLDPGEYVARVIGPDGSDDRTVQLAAGDRRRLTLEAPSGDDVIESPWLWVILGLVVVGAAVAIPVVVLTPQRRVIDPDPDAVFGTIRALRF